MPTSAGACHAGRVEDDIGEPVTSIHPGDDALATVAAQTLIETLPVPAGGSSAVPMKGRNLLVFSDSRQDAAFFAPYFERTARDLAIRAAIVRAIRRESDEPIDLQGLRDGVWGPCCAVRDLGSTNTGIPNQ